jgi:hypothetical protein
MQKTLLVFLFYLFHGFVPLHSQCLAALSPPVCTATEPLVADNEILNQGTTKYYYGAATTFNDLTLNGGTLVVAGDLTVNRFYMDSGTIYIHPGAHFVIGSGIGSGLQLKGNSAIYNYGSCELQRNLSLENSYASISKPNIVVNATSASIFRMPNQYFVINNPYSWFVNNGSAEFWGIITDNGSSAGSVCLGKQSITRMAVLINKVLNSYVVPDGTACLNVYQFSQFYNKLTPDRGLLVCLPAGHTSDAGCIPWGCQPNNWGEANVFSNCSGCIGIITLSTNFNSFTASAKQSGVNQLYWEMSSAAKDGRFIIYRSGDGSTFKPIDSFQVMSLNSQFNFTDKNPLTGNNYYMIKYTNHHQEGIEINSRIERIFKEGPAGISIYPMPFTQKITVSYSTEMRPQKIILTDVMGRNIPIREFANESAGKIDVVAMANLEPGLYVIHLQTARSVVANTIIKQ